KFAYEYNSADYRFAAIVVENGVTGTSSRYGQSNYYAGGSKGPLKGPNRNWVASASTVPASQMEYNMVGRALLGGFMGVSGSIPSKININDQFSKDFTYNVPSSYNPDNMYVIGLVIDAKKGNVENTNVEYLGNSDQPTSIAQTKQEALDVSVYPNPVSNLATVKIDMKDNAETSIIVYNMLGKEVMNKGEKTLSGGSHNYQLDFSNMESGIYFIKVGIGNKIITKKISVVK